MFSWRPLTKINILPSPSHLPDPTWQAADSGLHVLLSQFRANFLTHQKHFQYEQVSDLRSKAIMPEQAKSVNTTDEFYGFLYKYFAWFFGFFYKLRKYDHFLTIINILCIFYRHFFTMTRRLSFSQPVKPALQFCIWTYEIAICFLYSIEQVHTVINPVISPRWCVNFVSMNALKYHLDCGR